MEMNHSKYIEELKKALITVPQTGSKYSFDLVKDEENSEIFCFTYEKTLKDISVSTISAITSDDGHRTAVFINMCINSGCSPVRSPAVLSVT